MTRDPMDPKGLMREAYLIEGIDVAECRSIFFDWALSLPDGADARAAIAETIARHAEEPDHPMTRVLTEGLARPERTGRRGGRAGRTGGRE